MALLKLCACLALLALVDSRWIRARKTLVLRESSLLDHLLRSIATSSNNNNSYRGKRHHERRFSDNNLHYRTMSEDERRSYQRSRGHASASGAGFLDHFEVEVREAQNSSVCNYTVIGIPDPTGGSRIPRQLEHVKCNHVGSRCHERGTYCCLQTYRNVEVVYGQGGPAPRTEMLKVLSGCVCSLQIYGTLEHYSPELDIND